ncbi:MAG: conjugal transfer protein TraC [Candidatus Nealsonbacteria bacterium CG_4_8_14_3_um_filter_39_7]|uniref:Conjugal transfer protein TraC n=1 Tax=Candidatus Nealsonbacteria bacterium CG23_combo_of_CG06-09_8_20_14_all_39_17 TaxID=1974722 RepID=A0A2G9YTU6_9BACT|nr:MAG: conjugal transfer protein TraC [Candidatus Nealsonbacteria bacterium CG23_combo_of_CG06-09_8_20_14_all_39_17]PIW91119.1 MAG: conjugal transfer protein TraC [Candidatus Nealsonbacteria bacterium CG_4_8_14_3_um_filter_39_7]
MNLPFFKKRTEMPKDISRKQTIEARDIIAPSSVVINFDHIELERKKARSFSIFSYPRYLSTGWFSPIINLNSPMDIGIHINPIDTGPVLKKLRKKVTEVTADISEKSEKGEIRDPALEVAFQDMETLRDSLQTAQEKMFQMGLYLTVYGDNLDQLKDDQNTLRSILESRLIYLNLALYQQKEGFNSTAPYGKDQLQVYTSMNTEPLSSVFPFVSSDLSSNEGILYGLNKHNNSLILFDRFTLENSNMVIFAKSGSGKSYLEKIEILRQLMQGVDVIVLDPENEFRTLSDAVGGSFLDISLSAPDHINPFDLPEPREGERPEDILRSNIINLVGLLRIMLGGLTPEEDAIIDRALSETYASKDITPETNPKEWRKNLPILEDLETVLETMEGADSLVRRIKKFTKGTFSQFFNQTTNISTDKPLVVFGIRDMEDELRPMAMFIVMRYIWNKVRSELKKRILVIDEAWWLMKSEDGASFLYGICKRARKYWLGVTTITQDVNDFMKSSYGQPIISNSSIQILLKQSPATIGTVKQTFNLTEEEKYLLLESEVGEGIFFAGQKHVAIKVIASYAEDQIITTSPEEIIKIRKAKKVTL